jgi:chromosome partitioning protein
MRILAVYAAPWLREMWVDYLVVMDGFAGLSESTKAILMRADLAVIPIPPSGIDVQSVDAVRLIKQAQSVRQGPPKALMFLSRGVKGGNEAQNRSKELLGKLAPTIKPCSNRSFTKNK